MYLGTITTIYLCCRLGFIVFGRVEALDWEEDAEEDAGEEDAGEEAGGGKDPHFDRIQNTGWRMLW